MLSTNTFVTCQVPTQTLKHFTGLKKQWQLLTALHMQTPLDINITT
jgi:hypothetical protein